ncbi:MAG: DUF433 domain-containing protein [Micropepsaceae bacterium]
MSRFARIANRASIRAFKGAFNAPILSLISEWLSRITIRADHCHGCPCIRVMRIRVVDILEILSNGIGDDEIFCDVPDLERDDIRKRKFLGSEWSSLGKCGARTKQCAAPSLPPPHRACFHTADATSVARKSSPA